MFMYFILYVYQFSDKFPSKTVIPHLCWLSSKDYIIYQENNCKASIEQREIAKDYHDYEKSLLIDIENR